MTDSTQKSREDLYSNLFVRPEDDMSDIQLINRDDDPFAQDTLFPPLMDNLDDSSKASLDPSRQAGDPLQIGSKEGEASSSLAVAADALTSSRRRPMELPPLPPLSDLALPPSLSYNRYIPSISAFQAQPFKQLQSSQQLANKRKRDTARTRPAFVMKLWALINDPSNHEFIRWNDDGKLIRVFRSDEFKKNVLPRYFKHNNLTLFVRQLNMYGWHKVQDVTAGSMMLERDKKDADELMLFENENFVRGRPDLLDRIVRNSKPEKVEDAAPGAGSGDQSALQLVLSELELIKMNQMAIGEDLLRIRADNKTLWHDNYITRDRYQQQAQTLERILNFLAAMYGKSGGKLMEKIDVQNGMNGSNHKNSPKPKTSDFYAPAPPRPYEELTRSPYNKRQLMLTNNRHDLGLIDEIISSYSNNSNTHGPSLKSTDALGEQMHVPLASPASSLNSPNSPDLATLNVNKMYQQIIDQDQLALSPRSFFPELNLGSNSRAEPDQRPPPGSGQNQSSLQHQHTNDVINGLEQNMLKQGQSIQHVQDWIQKLARQQNPPLSPLVDPHVGPAPEDFDVSQFLQNQGQTPTPSSTGTTPPEVIQHEPEPVGIAPIGAKRMAPLQAETRGDQKRRR